MEITHKISLKARLAGGVAAVGLAACCMATPAFAITGTSASTEVTVTADQQQISWTAPTKIAFAASADGTLTGPSADAAKITNQSVFAIHATKMVVWDVDPFNLVDDVDASTETNAFQFSINDAKATADEVGGVDLSKDETWNMGYAGGGSDSISLTTSDAKIARVTADLSKEQKVATIGWTVAAGSATQA